jgi:hypothetical protein
MIYNILISSTSATSGDSTSAYEYNFDWGALEEGQYEMSMSFSAEGSIVFNALLISLQGLGCSMNSFITSSPTSQKFSNIIGAVRGVEDISAFVHYYAMHTDNPPVFLSSKPQGNQFKVLIKDLAGAAVDLGVDYILNLSLKKL